MPDNGTETGIKQEDTSQVEQLSIQQRTEAGNFISGYFWFGTDTADEYDISPWWSARRDWDLREFWQKPGNDILQGAVSSMVKKFKSMNWSLQGPERVVNKFQPVLANAEFGAGWSHFLGKVLTDYLTQDKGAFIELIGRGNPAGPIEGPVLGIAHLDSGLCQLTGDPTYPVIFNNTKRGIGHKLHASRVIHIVDMPSPNEAMNDVGFCGVSRVIASSQVLLKLARYKNEKLSDLPPAGMLLLNNISPAKWEDTQANYQRERRSLNQQLWANVMVLLGLDPTQPISAEFLSFAQLPDQFNEEQAINLYVNIVALAFGVDIREFWPASAGPLGTASETLVQHQKAKGKGVGDIITTLERAINWKVLPSSVEFYFDFQDDEEDKQEADINKVKAETIMNLWRPPTNQQMVESGYQPPISALEIRQMLADNVPYFKVDFLEVDATDEIELEDTEREKRLGPVVKMDSMGFKRRLKRVGQTGWGRKNVDTVLGLAEENYRAGRISLNDLMEFRLGQMMDERLERYGQSRD